jgi:hypothetical protein
MYINKIIIISLTFALLASISQAQSHITLARITPTEGEDDLVYTYKIYLNNISKGENSELFWFMKGDPSDIKADNSTQYDRNPLIITMKIPQRELIIGPIDAMLLIGDDISEKNIKVPNIYATSRLLFNRNNSMYSFEFKSTREYNLTPYFLEEKYKIYWNNILDHDKEILKEYLDKELNIKVNRIVKDQDDIKIIANNGSIFLLKLVENKVFLENDENKHINKAKLKVLRDDSDELYIYMEKRTDLDQIRYNNTNEWLNKSIDLSRNYEIENLIDVGLKQDLAIIS